MALAFGGGLGCTGGDGDDGGGGVRVLPERCTLSPSSGLSSRLAAPELPTYQQGELGQTYSSQTVLKM